MATCVVVPLGPACANLTGIRAGDRNLITATIKQKGEALDLTDLTITAQARKKAIDADPAISAVITVVDAVLGQITIRWPGDDVTTLLAGKSTWTGVWDLQVASGTEDPLTIVEGTFGAVMDVTR